MDHKLLNILLGTLPSPKSLQNNNNSSGEDCEMSPKEEEKKPSNH